MNIKYNKKKEELRRDPVLESIEKSRIFIKNQGNKLIASIVVIVLIFVGFQISSYLKNKKLEKTQDAFGKGMLLYSEHKKEDALAAFKKLVTDYPNTSHAAYSAFMVGHIYLSKDKYDEAIEYFQVASSNKKDKSFIRGEALIALATCYESKEDLEKSIQYFNKALENQNIQYRYPDIKWKMALIYKKLGNKDRVKYYCNELVIDTLATDYTKKAKNLLSVVQIN